MDGHVWRVPTLFGLMACSALLLFTAGVVGSLITRRQPSTIYKVGTGAVLVLLAISTAIVVRATATLIARSLGVDVTYVNPSLLGHLAPAAFAAFAFAVGKRMLGDAWGAHTRKDPAAKDRAIHWYGKAWPTLTGIDKEKVRDRLMKIYGPPPPPKTGMLPAGWRGSVSVDMKIDVLNGRTHSGSLAARLTPKGKGGLYDVMGAPLTPAKPGQKCEFSAWVFSDGTDGGGDIIQIQAQDASGKITALKQPLIQPDTPIWTRLTWSLELPANTTHIGMAILLNSTKGLVWVDDVSIQLDGLEALRSGTFEPQ
jgi:hypothetical protein